METLAAFYPPTPLGVVVSGVGEYPVDTSTANEFIGRIAYNDWLKEPPLRRHELARAFYSSLAMLN